LRRYLFARLKKTSRHGCKNVTKELRIVARRNRPILTTKTITYAGRWARARLASPLFACDEIFIGVPAYGIRALMRNRTDLQSHESFTQRPARREQQKFVKARKSCRSSASGGPGTGRTSGRGSRSSDRRDRSFDSPAPAWL